MVNNVWLKVFPSNGRLLTEARESAWDSCRHTPPALITNSLGLFFFNNQGSALVVHLADFPPWCMFYYWWLFFVLWFNSSVMRDWVSCGWGSFSGELAAQDCFVSRPFTLDLPWLRRGLGYSKRLFLGPLCSSSQPVRLNLPQWCKWSVNRHASFKILPDKLGISSLGFLLNTGKSWSACNHIYIHILSRTQSSLFSPSWIET